MAWLQAHWQDIVVALLAIDQVLIPIFPSVSLLQKFKSILSGIAPQK